MHGRPPPWQNFYMSRVFFPALAQKLFSNPAFFRQHKNFFFRTVNVNRENGNFVLFRLQPIGLN